MGNILSEESLKEKARREFREWEVKMYANNRYLHKIPSEARERKREEIRKRLGIYAESSGSSDSEAGGPP